ncbi:hypothetical protein BDA99DRAFT_507510 [Phascolomyces articulosus]|uniref:Rho-GAP domain-containing protein n=1 Tax=Phascolomyces articulosus TaxID=60185 RepID=A0AAD5KB64_9FUNG|nr:hypothetical protein BDA99DRAFT_507510 [Phascolomyces articulosus]
MARPRGKSFTQHAQQQHQHHQYQQQPIPTFETTSITASNELPNVNAQLDYINKLIKWNLHDIDNFIDVLTARIYAEETYIQSLERIERIAPVPEPEIRYFGNAQTSYQKATIQYKASVNGMLKGRKELLKQMRNQRQRLYNVRDTQENRRKKIKNILGEKNTNYLTYRSRDYVKRHNAYTNKCKEIDQAESEAEHQQQQSSLGVTSSAPMGGSTTTIVAGGGANPIPTNNPATTVAAAASSGGGGMLEEQGPRKSSDSDHSTSSHENSHRRRMAGLKALRTQLVNAMSSNVDPNTRVAKLKRDMSDLDREYRKSVVFMERLRRKQVETSQHAIKHAEVMFFDKSEMTKSVLHNILKVEQEMQEKEAAMTRTVSQISDQVDGRADVALFCTEYDKYKQRFDIPEQIHYDNYFHGTLKDVQFGTSLEAYAKIYQRDVPVLVEKCIQAVEDQGGLQKEGIYRVSGRQSNLDALKIDFEKDEANIQLSNYDVFTIASVLKVYLREMEQPLFGLPMKYRAEYSNKDDPTRLRELEYNLTELTDPHRNTLKALIEHLAKVTQHAEVNKMNVQNLTMIFTPAIFHDYNNAENPGEWCNDKVFSDLITHHHTLFASVEAYVNEKKQKQQPRKQSINAGHFPLPSSNNNNNNNAGGGGSSSSSQPPQASSTTLLYPTSNLDQQQVISPGSTMTLPSPQQQQTTNNMSGISTGSVHSNNSSIEPHSSTTTTTTAAAAAVTTNPTPSPAKQLNRSDSRGKKILARKDSLHALQLSPSLVQQQQQQQQQQQSQQTQHQRNASASTKELPPIVATAQPGTPEPSSTITTTAAAATTTSTVK